MTRAEALVDQFKIKLDGATISTFFIHVGVFKDTWYSEFGYELPDSVVSQITDISTFHARRIVRSILN